MQNHPIQPLKLSDEDRQRLRILFVAKHARSDGSPDQVDGTHATYHRELADTLLGLGLNVTIGNSYDDMHDLDGFDFVFTMLNRGGFLNSEMLGPLCARRRGTAHIGGSPILRGLGDDKHLMKLCAAHRGVATPKWEILRKGGVAEAPFFGPKTVVKPNASSASWGIAFVNSPEEFATHANWLFDQGHDVVVEEYVEGIEIAVPVIGDANGRATFLPVMQYISEEGDRLRTYEEKRGLKASTEGFVPLQDQEISATVCAVAEKLLPEIWPFDFGRFEFKFDLETGTARFLEVNMNCNLWSMKTLAKSWASLGHSHAELIETILTSSLIRQGLIETPKGAGEGEKHDFDSTRDGSAPAWGSRSARAS